MNSYVQIIGDSHTEIWGMSGRARLARLLERIDGITIITDESELPDGAPIIFLRGDYLFNSRLLPALVRLENEFALYDRHSNAVVAIRTDNYDSGIFETCRATGSAARIEPDDLVSPYDNRLKKYEPARVRRISADNREALEQELFSSSYKGVTDLVTKWLWPRPAMWATKICARLKLKPNHVTLFSLVLAILAGYAFWQGEFVGGLLLGWFMTFLDTVDGKLARVTLTSSRFGDLLDHGLDLVHPPFWYIAWGVGLTVQMPEVTPLTTLLGLMLAAYVGGRLCEGIFQHYIASFSIFMWQPVDSLTRLITARRNPNLLILTAALLAGRPDTGLVIVVAWHLLSTLFLLIRLAMAWKAKQDQGPLLSWLSAIGPGNRHNRLALKIFT